jgi:hypothetical protein
LVGKKEANTNKAKQEGEDTANIAPVVLGNGSMKDASQLVDLHKLAMV